MPSLVGPEVGRRKAAMSIKVSLRELFFKNNPIFYDAVGRLLLDTLAEELAAQPPPQVDTLTTELAEAKAEIERLDTECDRQALWRKETEQKLAKAKAEIEALRKDCDYLRRESGRADDARIDAGRQLAEAKAEIGAQTSRIRALEAAIRGYESQHGACGDCAADAEIGRLVRGMAYGARLIAGNGIWLGARLMDGPMPAEWDTPAGGRDPAEALRAIQEMGDA